MLLKYYIYIMKNLSGIYVISTYLMTYFSQYIDLNKIIIINMTVDHDRFIGKWPSPFSFKYIVYCGTMYGNKDGIHDLIDAYDRIKYKTDLKLVLIGDTLDKRSIYIKDLIREKNLEDRIVLTGSVESVEIPRYLKNAEILVLSRPDNLQAKSGFPTKLGEYLMTEKPIIITSVGDIPNFIKEGKNGFLVNPGNSELFAQKILYVSNNYKMAIEVARGGKETALNSFNYIIESAKLISFMNQGK
jgi:glycosyltransferase involved in cell wall biosynthesis